ncbi:MAG: sugar ABC transporter substrate-binding protein [Eubacteriales bacterium]|nr:sugar ABC transporter substrate-binding protein [Eubacteriales bacterium]
MKRILALVCILCLSLSCVTLASAEVSGSIRFSTWGSVAEKEINEAVIAAFEAEHPGCTVELEYIPESYTQKIDTEFIGGDAPDVIYGHPHYFVSWASNDLLMNLDELFEENHDFFYDEKFSTSMYDMLTYDGHHIGTINGHDTFLLYYNKDLFDAAGVAYPSDEWTWEDFLEAGKKLTNAENKQYAISFDEIQPIIFSFGGNYFDDMSNPTQVLYNSEDTVAALQFVQDCIAAGIAPNTTDAEQMGGTFATGKVAMQITGAWAVASYMNVDAFKWDVAQVPLREGYPRRTSAFVAGYAVNAASKNPELALEFAKYFQSDTAQKLLSSLGLITVINHEISGSDEVLKSPGSPEHASLRVTTIDNATNGYASLPNYIEMFNDVLKPAYQRLVAGSTTAAQCAQDIQDGMEKLMQEVN